MDKVAELLAGYPFDVLLGSVHWLGAWRFDDLGTRCTWPSGRSAEVDACWDAYAEAIEEMAGAAAPATCSAHPDLVKVAGYGPEHPEEWWDRLAEAAAASGLAAEVSSAGWRKPCAEQYPARGLLERVRRAGAWRSPPPRTPTATEWPIGPTTCGRCWRRPGSTGWSPSRPPGAAGTGVADPGSHRRGGGLGDGHPGRAGQAPAVLEPDELSHLQRLLGSWSLFSDLSFSDLVLCGADRGTHRRRRGAPAVVLGQIRPYNRPTRLFQDLVGRSVPGDEWSIAAEALRTRARSSAGRSRSIDRRDPSPLRRSRCASARR